MSAIDESAIRRHAERLLQRAVAAVLLVDTNFLDVGNIDVLEYNFRFVFVGHEYSATAFRPVRFRALRRRRRFFFVVSLSAKTLIYTGMLTAQQLSNFYPDLRDPRFESALAIFHQRYSTNTFPTWRLAQPFRMLAHNGEINTLKGNLNWLRSHEIRMASSAFGDMAEDIKPIVAAGSSDSSPAMGSGSSPTTAPSLSSSAAVARSSRTVVTVGATFYAGRRLQTIRLSEDA